MGAEAKLQELGIVLPDTAAPGGNYVPAKTVGSIVYLSGVISADEGGLITGRAGLDRTIEDGYAAARRCGLAQLAALKKHLGSLDVIHEIVSLNGYVNATDDFTDAPSIINGASDLMIEVFGESGRHVRAALGVNALPRNALVELQMVVSLKPNA
jgi:enamine deaminase RidA (YjgF/YER057c/UK114 family)